MKAAGPSSSPIHETAEASLDASGGVGGWGDAADMQFPGGEQGGNKKSALQSEVCYNGTRWLPVLLSPSSFPMRSTILPLSFSITIACLGIGELSAQVVQLPSFRNFSVNGGAIVPDGGTTSLGGVGYATSQSTSAGWGPYAVRSGSSSVGGAAVSVSASIIDLQALDEAILGRSGTGVAASTGTTGSTVTAGPLAPANSAPVTGDPTTGNSTELTGVAASAAAASAAYRNPGRIRSIPPSTGYTQVLAGGLPEIPPTSVLDLDNVGYYIRKGRQAEDAGRHHAAEVYFRMALESMPPQLKDEYFKAIDRREMERIQKEKDNIRRAGARRF